MKEEELSNLKLEEQLKMSKFNEARGIMKMKFKTNLNRLRRDK